MLKILVLSLTFRDSELINLGQGPMVQRLSQLFPRFTQDWELMFLDLRIHVRNKKAIDSNF